MGQYGLPSRPFIFAWVEGLSAGCGGDAREVAAGRDSRGWVGAMGNVGDLGLARGDAGPW